LPRPNQLMRLMEAPVWRVVTYGCESWTLRKNEVTRLDAFEMNGLRKILWVSWTAKKTNDSALNNAGVKKELQHQYTDVSSGTLNPTILHTTTGLSVEESFRMTEDRDKWRKYAHGVTNPRIEDG